MGILQVQRNWVVYCRSNAPMSKVSSKTFPVGNADHVKMVNRMCPGRLVGQHTRLNSGRQQSPVDSCTVSSLLVPDLEMPELDRQNPRLNRIQSTVVALDFMIVLLGLTMIAQLSDFLREREIIRCDRPCFAARSQILAGVKAEGAGRSHRACLLPTVFLLGKIFRPMRLTSVFYDN